ncbi:hypothetical protein ACEZDB_03195 [Streptacidiphilus sp. N1-3]|uniref:DUF4435 domain-containing protein n=1 Tax=Streptacidiphilus alkalitolerans TaxID=3342712 RepID=A0ABV6WVN1_9ACTN
MSDTRRLTYTRAAFARRILLSQDKLFLVVEGKDMDSRFYDSICSASVSIRTGGYQIWLAEQIRDDTTGVGSGGKKAVLSIYEYFKSSRRLTISSSAGKRSIAFMLDRDNEDLTGGRKRSPHVIYTDMFDVEAEAFVHGNPEAALGSLFSLDSASATSLASDISTWIFDLADAWREWITLCCIAKKSGSYCDVGFGKESWINSQRYGPVETQKATAAISKISSKAPVDQATMTALEKAIRSRIKSSYSSSTSHRLVKGKWLAPYLIYRVRDHFGSAPIMYDGTQESAAKFFLSSCDFSAGWTSYYRNKLEALR